MIFSTTVVVFVDPEHSEAPLVRVVRDLSGSAANAGASTQTFNQGGLGFPGGFGGGLSGSAANVINNFKSSIFEKWLNFILD